MADFAEPKSRSQSYLGKLRDPRWQKKRLEVLQRDDFTCLSCQTVTQTLHVHHCYYSRDVEPWEYPTPSLLTLCADCHQSETDAGPYNKLLIFEALAARGLTGSQIDYLAFCLFRIPPGIDRDRLYSTIRDALCSLILEATDA